MANRIQKREETACTFAEETCDEPFVVRAAIVVDRGGLCGSFGAGRFGGRRCQHGACCTFWRSLDALGELAQTFVLVLVGLAPWFVVLLLLVTPLVWWIRRRIQRQPPTIVVAQSA